MGAVVISPDTQRLLDEAASVARVAIRDGTHWNDRRLPECGRTIEALIAEVERLLTVEAERDTLREALERIVDDNYLRSSDDGWQGMCARQGRLAREVLAALSSPVAEDPA